MISFGSFSKYGFQCQSWLRIQGFLRRYAITWQLLRFSSDVVLFDIFPSTDQNRFGQLCNSFELLYRFWSISPIMLFLKEMQNIIHDTTICSFNVLFIPQIYWKVCSFASRHGVHSVFAVKSKLSWCYPRGQLVGSDKMGGDQLTICSTP